MPASGTLSKVALETLLAERATFLAFLERRLDSRDVAEDVLQAAYAQALAKGGALRRDETVVAWFYRLLRRAVVDRRRRGGTAARALERLARELEEAQSPELDNRVCQCVSALLTTLKPAYRNAIEVVDLSGEPVPTYAAQEQISANYAAVRLHRARAALEERVRATCGACSRHGCVDCTCRAPPARP